MDDRDSTPNLAIGLLAVILFCLVLAAVLSPVLEVMG